MGRQTHPPAGVSAVRETHDNVGTAGRGVKQAQERKSQPLDRSPI